MVLILGIAFDDGQLTILQPGRHVIDKSTFMFSAFLSTGQETLPIDQITSLSSDNVGLAFSAAFSLQVVDAAKAVTMLGRDLTERKKTTSSSQDLPFSTSYVPSTQYFPLSRLFSTPVFSHVHMLLTLHRFQGVPIELARPSPPCAQYHYRKQQIYGFFPQYRNCR